MLINRYSLAELPKGLHLIQTLKVPAPYHTTGESSSKPLERA
jgi:hypothetical protein